MGLETAYSVSKVSKYFRHMAFRAKDRFQVGVGDLHELLPKIHHATTLTIHFHWYDIKVDSGAMKELHLPNHPFNLGNAFGRLRHLHINFFASSDSQRTGESNINVEKDATPVRVANRINEFMDGISRGQEEEEGQQFGTSSSHPMTLTCPAFLLPYMNPRDNVHHLFILKYRSHNLRAVHKRFRNLRTLRLVDH
jgi:hypothetical protein